MRGYNRPPMPYRIDANEGLDNEFFWNAVQAAHLTSNQEGTRESEKNVYSAMDRLHVVVEDIWSRHVALRYGAAGTCTEAKKTACTAHLATCQQGIRENNATVHGTMECPQYIMKEVVWDRCCDATMHMSTRRLKAHYNLAS